MYSASLKGSRETISKTNSRPTIVLANLGRGTYELSYNMTIGAGSGQQTTKTTVVTVKVPGGIQPGQRSAKGSSRRQERR